MLQESMTLSADDLTWNNRLQGRNAHGLILGILPKAYKADGDDGSGDC
jgi:hypothetical protein